MSEWSYERSAGPLSLSLAIGGGATSLGSAGSSRTYGILGQVLETTSADAGDRQALTTILGEPLRGWDAKDQCVRVTYDDLRRPVDSYVQPPPRPRPPPLGQLELELNLAG